MKNIKFVGFALAALSFASCDSDWLTVAPPTSIGEADFYKTEKDLKEALVSAYAPMGWEAYESGWGTTVLVSDIMADDVRSGNEPGDQPYLHPMDEYASTALNSSGRWWTLSFRGVYRSNQVLENLKNAIAAGMDAETAARYRAEAIFLRAYHYYNLWRFYGNIPYYETNLTYPYVCPQVAPDEVYQAVIWGVNGLDSVIDDLPDLNSNKAGGANSLPAGDLGRATKAAAQMLKARWVMYQMDESKFPDVLADMKEIINGGKFALKTTRTVDYSVAQDAQTPAMSYTPSVFETLFMDEGEWCEETIFDINHTDEGSTNNWGQGGFAGGSVGPYMQGPRDLVANNDFANGGYGFGTVIKETYDMYDDADTRKDGSIINMDKWEANYEATMGVKLTFAESTTGEKAWRDTRPKETGFYMKKNAPRKGYNQRGSGTGTDVMAFRNNVRIFRYAETLLNAAELSVRTGGGEAQAWLDQIRARAYGDDDHSIPATLENIMTERHKEFVGEGIRYWDLVRTGQAANVLSGNPTYYGTGWKSNITTNGITRWLWPIPESEVSKSASTPYPLIQNVGY